MGLSAAEQRAARRAFDTANSPNMRATLDVYLRNQSTIAATLARATMPDPGAGIREALRLVNPAPVGFPAFASPFAAVDQLAERLAGNRNLVDRALMAAVDARPATGALAALSPQRGALGALSPQTGALGALSSQTGTLGTLSSSAAALMVHVQCARCGVPTLTNPARAGFAPVRVRDQVAEVVRAAGVARLGETQMQAIARYPAVDFASVASRLPTSLARRDLLSGARTAVAQFDLATAGIKAQFAAVAGLEDRTAAFRSGLATAGMLGGRIELSANRLSRLGPSPWSRLPAGSLSALAAMSTTLLPPSAARDLLSVARGTYGVTAFAARAGSVSAGVDVDDAPDTVVEEWADGSVTTELRSALAAIHPRLAEKLEGAWHAYQRRGPDFLGQTATSAIELIDRTLERLAPAEECRVYAADNGLAGEMFWDRRGPADDDVEGAVRATRPRAGRGRGRRVGGQPKQGPARHQRVQARSRL